MKEKSFLKDKSIFRIALLTTVFFFSAHFLQYVSYVAIVLILLWGIGLIIRDLAYGKLKKTYFYAFSLMFLSIGVISHVIALLTGDGSGFATAVGMALLIITAEFMFLFMPNRDTKKGVVERELYIVAKIYYFSAIVLNVIGIILLLIFKTSLGERIIIYDNRFVGAYINPNMGAFCCFLSVVAGVLLSNKKFCINVGKVPMKKLPCYLGMALSYFVIAISDSKGALLALTVFLVSYLLFSVYKFKVKPRKRHVPRIIYCLLVLVLSLALVTPSQKLMATVVNSTGDFVTTTAQAQAKNEKSKTTDKDAEITFDHQEEKEKNGGGRLTLYKQSFEFFLQKPIFGWGCGNMLLMGDATEANTIDNLKLDLGAKIFEPHNGYLTILATSGIVGFLTFACMILIAVVAMLKNAFLKVKYGGIGRTACVVSAFIAFLVYALVEPSLVYYPSLVVAVFWFFMGAGVKWATENKNIKLSVPAQKAIGFREFDE